MTTQQTTQQVKNQSYIGDFINVKKHFTKIEFLDIMIDIMEEVQRKSLSFSMNTWGDYVMDTKLDEVETFEQYQETLHTCGTSCCMLGWAASDKRFVERGLFLDKMFDLAMKVDGKHKESYNWFNDKNLHTLCGGMSKEELLMLFGADDGQRMEGYIDVFGINSYSDIPSEEYEKLPNHLKYDEDNTQDAIDCLEWYKQYLIDNPEKQ